MDAFSDCTGRKISVVLSKGVKNKKAGKPQTKKLAMERKIPCCDVVYSILNTTAINALSAAEGGHFALHEKPVCRLRSCMTFTFSRKNDQIASSTLVGRGTVRNREEHQRGNLSPHIFVTGTVHPLFKRCIKADARQPHTPFLPGLNCIRSNGYSKKGIPLLPGTRK
uniref:Uncharacterized protein n=1 Tax=Romanomermis culicivorax TaxID=13658 RepID=A0A915I8S0_ROMCU